MKNRIATVLALVGLSMTGMVLAAGAASAHTPSASASCQGVHLHAQDYDSNKANKWSVTIGGDEQHGTFGASYDHTFAVPQAGATTSWSAVIQADDGGYKGTYSGTVGPCGTPPPPYDECKDLPGNQPAGTECTHGSVVETTPKHEESCALGGANDWNKVVTTKYVFNQQTNHWDAQTPVTTYTDKVFTPWSTQKLEDEGCTQKPPVVVVKDKHEESCALGGSNDWTETTTTTYSYVNGSWVANDPTVVDSAKVFTPWNAQKLEDEGCSQKPPLVTTVPKTDESCELGHTTWTETTTINYVYVQGQWVAQEPVVTDSEHVNTPYNTEEQETYGCAKADTFRTVSTQEESCALGGVNKWDQTFKTVYQFTDNVWVALPEVLTSETNKVFTPYTADEQEAKGCYKSPLVTTTPKHEESCLLKGANDWTETSTVNYTWNGESWDANDAVVTDSPKVFTAYTESQLEALGCVTVVISTPPIHVTHVVNTLPNTGGPNLALGVTGFALLLAGGGALLLSRRRA